MENERLSRFFGLPIVLFFSHTGEIYLMKDKLVVTVADAASLCLLVAA